jgi:hypothetical protein
MKLYTAVFTLSNVKSSFLTIGRIPVIALFKFSVSLDIKGQMKQEIDLNIMSNSVCAVA